MEPLYGPPLLFLLYNWIHLDYHNIWILIVSASCTSCVTMDYHVLLCILTNVYMLHHCVSIYSPCPLKEPESLDRSYTCFPALLLGRGLSQISKLLEHVKIPQTLQRLHGQRSTFDFKYWP